MSNFEFAKMPKEYDYFSSPAPEKPRRSLSMYGAWSGPVAAGDGHSSFEFAKSVPRDFFGNVIETKPESNALTEPFEFAPTRKQTGYFDSADETGDAVPEGEFRKSGRRAFKAGDRVRYTHGGRRWMARYLQRGQTLPAGFPPNLNGLGANGLPSIWCCYLSSSGPAYIWMQCPPSGVPAQGTSYSGINDPSGNSPGYPSGY